jgi:S-adenosylmethionine-diacylgycerolhomoserine-N-methlytransferase
MLKNVELRTALAENYDHASTFGLDRKFDAVFFSYSISMIPVWREAIANALANLRPGGTLYIVDFYDQQDLPGWFRSMLKSWLRRFHVQFWNDLMPFVHNLQTDGSVALTIEPVARRYAFIASLQKPLTY